MLHSVKRTCGPLGTPKVNLCAVIVTFLAGVYVAGFFYLVVRGNGGDLPRHSDDRIFLNVRRSSPFRMTPFLAWLYYPLLVLHGAEETDLDIPFRSGRYLGFAEDLGKRLGISCN